MKDKILYDRCERCNNLTLHINAICLICLGFKEEELLRLLANNSGSTMMWLQNIIK